MNILDKISRRAAIFVSLGLIALVLAGLAVRHAVIAARNGGDNREASAATEFATCEEQVLFLLNNFVYDEAVERLGACPDAADGDEPSRLMKETYALAGVYKDANVFHPLADLPFSAGWEDNGADAPTEPSVEGDIVSPSLNKLVLYRQALAAFRRKNFSLCLELLERAGEGQPLEDYRLHLRALALFYSGDYGGVGKIVEKFAAAYRESLLYPDMRVLEAGALLKQGIEEQALAQLEKAVSEMETSEGRGRALTAIAGIHAAGGRSAQVVETALRIAAGGIEKGGDTTYSEALWDVLKEFDWRNAPPEAAEKIGKYFLDAGRPYRALTTLKRAAKKHPVADVQLLLGKAELATGNPKDARADFEAARKKTSDQDTLREVCFGAAGSLKAVGKLKDAAAAYNACYEKFREYSYLPLQELAWMYWGADEEGKALAAMKILVEQFPRLEGNDTLFRLLGRRAYLDRRYDDALRYYGELLQYFPESSLAPFALYWMGRMYAERGDENQARKNYSEIATRFPYSYYYYRVRGQEQTAAPWAGAERDYGGLIEVAAGNPHLRNGYALLAVGMTTDAEREFGAVGGGKGAAESREAAVGLSRALRRGGDIPASTKILEKSVEADAEWYCGVMASGALRELLFPTLYRDEVSAAAREFDADENAIFAVIRQESRFDSRARSSSNALGLMQIIPSTGDWSAEKMGLRGFKTNLLYMPGLNVRMGTWYLKLMNEKFGSFPLALAAYNWGPGNLSRWKNNHDDDDTDRFIESIPRAETRRYVNNCMLNFFVYQSINKSDSGL